MEIRSILFYFTCLGRMPPVSASIPHSEAKYPAQYNSSHNYRSPVASSTDRPLTSSTDRPLTSSSSMEGSLAMSSGMAYHKHTSPQGKAIDAVEANVLWLQKSLMQEMAYLKVGRFVLHSHFYGHLAMGFSIFYPTPPMDDVGNPAGFFLNLPYG